MFQERTHGGIIEALKFHNKLPYILLDLLRAATLLANWHYSGARREGTVRPSASVLLPLR